MSDCCNTTHDVSHVGSDIEKLEQEIKELKLKLAFLRSTSPPQKVEDYGFDSHQGEKTTLRKLFGDKDDLIVIHNMGTHCVYCTMWADGFNGLYDHLSSRAGFVVISNDDVAKQKKFKEARKWRFEMVSSIDTDFFKDMGFLLDSDSPWGKFAPGVSTFKRDKNGTIYKVASSKFGPGDNYCITWDLFDLLEKGVDGWQVKFKYD
ncbi:MAG: DUF899 family protein [Candidatus Obscuribacterales bacterium]|nr:DUF899 family protein [Candidatus Obscuribacterales bacterium]